MSTPVQYMMDAQRSRTATNNLMYPEDLGPQGMLMIFKDYKFSDSRNSNTGSSFVSAGTESVGDTILLPLPKNLQDNYNINITNQQLGVFGEGVGKIMGETVGEKDAPGITNAIMSAMQKNMPSGSEAYKAVAAMFGMGQNNESDLTSKLSFLGRRMLNEMPGGLGRAVDAGLGSIVNPKAAIAFDGMTLKHHTFDWEFIPQSENESDIIKNIFKVLKKNSLPSYIHLKSGAQEEAFSRALLKYPSLVDIFLIGIDQSHYLYYKTAMISQIAINFTPQQGHVIMSGGKPGAVTLSLVMMETDIHTSEDYGGVSSEDKNGSLTSDIKYPGNKEGY